jgi:hypothetical protein
MAGSPCEMRVAAIHRDAGASGVAEHDVKSMFAERHLVVAVKDAPREHMAMLRGDLDVAGGRCGDADRRRRGVLVLMAPRIVIVMVIRWLMTMPVLGRGRMPRCGLDDRLRSGGAESQDARRWFE